MPIYDGLNTTPQVAGGTAQSAGFQRETFRFTALPENLAQMQAFPWSWAASASG